MAGDPENGGVFDTGAQHKYLNYHEPRALITGWTVFKSPKNGSDNYAVFPECIVGWEIGGDEMADVLRRLVGDGKGKVSVGVDMSEKDFGNGFGASVMVTLTCDQSGEGVYNAGAEAGEIAKALLREKYVEMDIEFEKVKPAKR